MSPATTSSARRSLGRRLEDLRRRPGDRRPGAAAHQLGGRRLAQVGAAAGDERDAPGRARRARRSGDGGDKRGSRDSNPDSRFWRPRAWPLTHSPVGASRHRSGRGVRAAWEHTFVHVRPADDHSYAYLLGVYLGDGHVADTGRNFQPVITLDAAYTDLVEECREATVLSLPSSHPRTHRHPTYRSIRVTAGSLAWPRLFPQMGPGRKHERTIALAAWQREIVERHPWRFVRGLIHSDGCRTVNRFETLLPSGRVAAYAYTATSSATSSRTSAGCSARAAIGWACAGRSPTTATSRSLTGRASRYSRSMSVASADAVPHASRRPSRRRAGPTPRASLEPSAGRARRCATAAARSRAAGAARAPPTGAPAP